VSQPDRGDRKGEHDREPNERSRSHTRSLPDPRETRRDLLERPGSSTPADAATGERLWVGAAARAVRPATVATMSEQGRSRSDAIALAATALAIGGALILVILLFVEGGQRRAASTPAPPATYRQVQQILASNCVACHPTLVSSLDLTPAHAYASLVGVRSVEVPSLMRVIAGDPSRSWLYLKIGGAGNPTVGARMPLGLPPLSAHDIATIRSWITSGAKNAAGQTVSANEVATPGSLPALAQAAVPQISHGNATITGRITDANDKPIPGALVTLLLVRRGLPGGEEHYLAAVANSAGRYTITGAPIGHVELKAYAPGRVYVSRQVVTTSRRTAMADIGLPTQALQNPTIAQARVTHRHHTLTLQMNVTGQALDRNYTLAINPATGRVYELRATGTTNESPGRWIRNLPARGLHGAWIFLAVSHTCTVSNFIRVNQPTA
jgi:mono/diheme cytochrome c family protein